MKHSYGLILTDSFVVHLRDLEKSGWLCGENGSGTMHGIVGGFERPNLPSVCQGCRKEADKRESQPTSGMTKCDVCGDESNSAPGLMCGRVEEDDPTETPCAGTYRTGDEGRILYAVTAQIIPFQHAAGGWRSNGLQLPTFYLDPSVQGIMDETHAKIIARAIVDPYHIYHNVELTIARVPASVMLRP